MIFFFSSRRRHTRYWRDWSSDVCSSDLEFEWRVLFVAGMWFQDLFNYDFRRTEMCIIPYGTQMGEISFCAYNTGVGWRNIVERSEERRVGKECRARWEPLD